MKKVINWTFGSVFRTFGRILAYIAIGALFALIMSKNNVKITDLLGFEKVNASTSITPSSWGSKVSYYKIDRADSSNNDTFTSNWLTGDYTNFCGDSTRYSCYLQKNWYYVVLSTSLDSGKTYTMNFSTWLTDRASQSYYANSTYTMIASNTGAYNGSSSANISALTCRPGIAEGTTSKVDWSCSFTPTTQVNYLYLTINFATGNPLFTSYGVNRASLNYDNSQTDAINNQTNIIQNEFNDITNQINENNQLILDGLEGINEANQVCQIIDKNYITIESKYLDPSGVLLSHNAFGVTDYIDIADSKFEVLNNRSGQAATCFYGSNKSLISCVASSDLTIGLYNVPNGTFYFRSSIQVSENRPTFKVCKNGNQALNDTLTDDNTSEAENEANDFFSNFTTNTHGLTGIITAPLSAIERLTSSSCSPLVLPLPYINQNLTLPCMRQIYENNFGSFMTIYDVVTLGIVSYWILVSIFSLVKDFKNPDHDEIEVVDL